MQKSGLKRAGQGIAIRDSAAGKKAAVGFMNF
jgi:hypothetical protein